MSIWTHKASGISRFCWNWGLAAWQHHYEAYKGFPRVWGWTGGFLKKAYQTAMQRLLKPKEAASGATSTANIME